MADPTPPWPLTALLGRTQSRFLAECEQRLAAAGYPDLRVAHGANILRHLERDTPLSSAALVRLSGVTKQAVSQQVGHLATLGYLVVAPGVSDARSKDLTLTDRGVEARNAIHATFGAVEHAWEERYGAAGVQALRTALEDLMERLGPL